MLDNFTDSSWKFTYDAFDRCGTISKIIDEEAYVNNGRSIERITIKLGLAIYLQADETGAINTIPALYISSSGAYRPYIRSATLNTDGIASDLAAVGSDYNINILEIDEETYLEFTAETLEQLAKASDVAIRLRGSGNNYDIDLASVAEELKEFAQNIKAQQ